MRKTLLAIYNKLFKAFGPRHWWPADNAFEVIIGAILTQNTAWKNVERAICNIKENSPLTPAGLKEVGTRKLAAFIRPSGYYNIKAERIKNFLDVLSREFKDDLRRMFKTDTKKLRKKLISIKGIGFETADSILLYAAGRPVFLVDNYTRRIFSRHGIVKADSSYEDIQTLFMDNLPHSKKLFNEYHALIVQLGKEFCRRKPRCQRCPLKPLKLNLERSNLW